MQPLKALKGLGSGPSRAETRHLLGELQCCSTVLSECTAQMWCPLVAVLLNRAVLRLGTKMSKAQVSEDRVSQLWSPVTSG